MAKNSVAKIKANNKHTKDNYINPTSYFKLDEMALIEKYCEKFGCSKNSLITGATMEKIAESGLKLEPKELEEFIENRKKRAKKSASD